MKNEKKKFSEDPEEGLRMKWRVQQVKKEVEGKEMRFRP